MSVWVEPKSNAAKCRKWLVRAEVGTSRKSKVFEGTKRDALSFGRTLESELKNQKGSDTFSNFAREWNEARLASRSITQSTYEQYLYLLNGASLHIGNKRLDKITSRDVETALAALSMGDTPSGHPWSGTTLRACYKASRKVFSEAVARGLARTNPADNVTAPRSDTKPKKALSLEESARLIKAFESEGPHGFACSLMLKTGMRAGECLSAKWSDVTEDGIRITRELTKTQAGVRLIPLDGDTKRMIEDRRELVSGFLGQFGHEIDSETKLCCTKDGRPLTYNALKHWWERNRSRLGLDGFTIHELRHTFATNLAQAGVHPAIMAALLGHASSEITMEIYTHIHNADAVRAIETLGKARTSMR